VEWDGGTIAGEAAWRAALDTLDADARLAVWEALGDCPDDDDLPDDGRP
jgi:hypothetical protein